MNDDHANSFFNSIGVAGLSGTNRPKDGIRSCEGRAIASKRSMNISASICIPQIVRWMAS